MRTGQLSGWLFDIDELGSEVVLWVYGKSGRLFRLTHEFFPSVYVEGDRQRLDMLAWEVRRRGFIERLRWTRRKDFRTGEAKSVLELQIGDSGLLPRLRKLAASRRELTFYNIDLPTTQYYLYTHNLFPLCNLEAEVDEYGRVLEVQATQSPFEIQLALPRLRTLRMSGIEAMPLTSQSKIILECGDEDIQIKPHDGAKAILTFNEFIERHDPDLILSKRGDALLFPILFKIANEKKQQLFADRDRRSARRTISSGGRIIKSYTRGLCKSPDYPLRGRWHIDVKNSFFHKQTGVDGILELSRLSKIPVQRMARQSPGTAMASIGLDLAVRQGILIN
jgi:DNA polymerase elongation subunit (family B)